MGLAAAGVLLLADVQWQASAAGVVAALGAAALWAVYILAGGRVGGAGQRARGPDLGARSSARWRSCRSAWPASPPASRVFRVVAGCAGVALLSNVVPYSLDQLVLPRLTAGQFALLLSLLPVTATILGALLLGQHPTGPEIAGIGLVIGRARPAGPSLSRRLAALRGQLARRWASARVTMSAMMLPSSKSFGV